MKASLYMALILSVSLIAMSGIPWIFGSELPFAIRLILSTIALLPGVGLTVMIAEEIKEDYWE